MLKKIEATEEQEKSTEDITKMSAATTDPKQPSPIAEGTIRRLPKQESKLAKATNFDFDGYVDCYLYQPATPSPTEAKKNGERTLRSERFRKRLLNSQLEACESDNEDKDPTFVDPDHTAEDNEEEKEKTIEATTAAPPVE